MNDDIKGFISTVLTDELHRDPSAVTDEVILGVGGLGLESLDLLYVIYTLSDEYHITMSDDLGPYHGMTVSDLAAEVAAARVAA
jgi:acyl carrier protein